MNRITGSKIPAYFLGRPREAYEARYDRKAEVFSIDNRTSIETMRLRAA